jgi:hypothetical protein
MRKIRLVVSVFGALCYRAIAECKKQKEPCMYVCMCTIHIVRRTNIHVQTDVFALGAMCMYALRVCVISSEHCIRAHMRNAQSSLITTCLFGAQRISFAQSPVRWWCFCSITSARSTLFAFRERIPLLELI